jgi:hypothetical protein
MTGDQYPSEPTPRQVLYALVAGGFVLVVAVLVVGAAVAGLAPAWWTATAGIITAVWAIWAGINWRRTLVVLLGSILLLAVWAVVTLVVS